MSKKTLAHVEEKEFLVKEFIWVDGEFNCSSGTLLSVLDKLSNNEVVNITDSIISSYLSDKGLIVPISDAKYGPAEGKTQACVTLGNNISNAISKKLSELKPEEIDYITKK